MNLNRFAYVCIYIIYIYVTVNVHYQGMCIYPEIFRVDAYSLIHSGNVYIPWKNQGIYIYPEIFEWFLYTYPEKLCNNTYSQISIHIPWKFQGMCNIYCYISQELWSMYICLFYVLAVKYANITSDDGLWLTWTSGPDWYEVHAWWTSQMVSRQMAHRKWFTDKRFTDKRLTTRGSQQVAYQQIRGTFKISNLIVV